ncbi:unnamed protein product [Adineta ricciae]|uniref:Uncharacterized protein n=1 Tax=Adineta ricciae TaxID=249248 RepID=A0A815YLD6_ADIRI|nr:unnamed protein product [Adineta ricciae]CAF1571181.1 unnamed protein product [Adineta ricciae]
MAPKSSMSKSVGLRSRLSRSKLIGGRAESSRKLETQVWASIGINLNTTHPFTFNFIVPSRLRTGCIPHPAEL